MEFHLIVCSKTIPYFIKEHFPRKTQAAYKMLKYSKQNLQSILFTKNKECSVKVWHGENMQNSHMERKFSFLNIHACLISCELFNTVLNILN